jgi:type IV secretory pathway TrbD component
MRTAAEWAVALAFNVLAWVVIVWAFRRAAKRNEKL